MGMVIAPICFSNVGSIERGRISPESTYSIDKVIVKMSDGKRKTRYAVCVDHCWKSNQQMTLREAREHIAQLKHDYSRPNFKPITADGLREYAKQHGNRAAHDLLLLGGYGCLEGTCKDYDELLKEFERGASNAVRQGEV